MGFQYGHTKIFFRAGILGLMEEIRDDRINDLVSMLQGAIRAYYARRIYKKLWDHKMGLLVAQRTIRNYMIGKKWLWWTMWLALKPNLKSGHFEEFKQELAEKTQYAQDHLDEVTREREEAERKHARITGEIDEIKVSLAGGTNAKEGLQKEINGLNSKIAGENENVEHIQEGLKKTEANQSSLGREMRECETRLATVQDEKADKDAQIK